MSLPHMNGGAAVSAAAAASLAHQQQLAAHQQHQHNVYHPQHPHHHAAAALGLGGLGLGLSNTSAFVQQQSNGNGNSPISQLVSGAGGGQLVASPSIDSVSTSGIGSASVTPSNLVSSSTLSGAVGTAGNGGSIIINQSVPHPAMATSPHPTVNAIQEKFLLHYDSSFQWLIQEAQKGCDHLTMSRLLKEMRNAFWDLMGYAVKKAESQGQSAALLLQQQQLNAQLQAQLQTAQALAAQAQQNSHQTSNGNGPVNGHVPGKRGRKPKNYHLLQQEANGNGSGTSASSTSSGGSNGRDLADYIGDSQGPAYTLEQANARINQIKSSNLHITVSSDMERVNEWLALRPGTSGHSLTVDQRRDVVQFYEMFKPKYSVKWLICQIESKYGLSSLRGYFTRFMSKCYKVTNQGVKIPRGAGGTGGGTGAPRGRKPGSGLGRGAGSKYRSIESMIGSENGTAGTNGGGEHTNGGPVNGNGAATNGGTTPKKKGGTSNGIGRNRSGKLGQTAAEDLDRVEQWIATGTKRDGNLTVDQKRDVIHFYEAFRDKYIPAWLAKQIARKYDMKKLQFDFNRFMARCYKSTGQMDGPDGSGSGSGSGGHSAGAAAAHQHHLHPSHDPHHNNNGHHAGPSAAHQQPQQRHHHGLNGGDKMTPEPESSSSAGSKTPLLSAGLPLQLTAASRSMISNPVLNMSNGGQNGGSGGQNGGTNGNSNGGSNQSAYNGLMHQIVASQANRALSLRMGDHLGENGGNGSQQEAGGMESSLGIGGQAWPGSRVGLNMVRHEQQGSASSGGSGTGGGSGLAGLDGELDPQQIQELCELSQRQAQAAAMKMEQHFQYY